MSEASTASTTKRRRNPFLETASEPTPDPIDYAHSQRAPRTLAAYARPIRVRWGVGLLVAFGAGALEISIPQVLQIIVAPPRAPSGLPVAWCFCWALRTPPSCIGGAG